MQPRSRRKRALQRAASSKRDSHPELRGDSGNPMAAGCEGTSMPEAAGCGYCGACGWALVVKRSAGLKKMVPLPRRWRVANFRPRCPPRNVYYTASGGVVCTLAEAARCNPSLCRRLPDATQVSAGGCQMQPKSLPEAARCNPSLCRRLPDATQVSAGGCQMQPKSLPEAARCNPSLCRRLPDANKTPAGV